MSREDYIRGLRVAIRKVETATIYPGVAQTLRALLLELEKLVDAEMDATERDIDIDDGA